MVRPDLASANVPQAVAQETSGAHTPRKTPEASPNEPAQEPKRTASDASLRRDAARAASASLLFVTAMLIASAGLTAYAWQHIMNTSATCSAAVEFQGPELLRWWKWLSPPGKTMATSGTCVPTQLSETYREGGALPEECPSSCDCSGTYEGFATRFNECLRQAHRHLECAVHVDCEGEFTAVHVPEPHAYATLSHACPFLEREAFLSECEALTAYADRRDGWGWTVVLAFGIAAGVWLLVGLKMCRTSIKRRRRSRIDQQTAAEPPDAVDGSGTDEEVAGGLADGPAAAPAAAKAGQKRMGRARRAAADVARGVHAGADTALQGSSLEESMVEACLATLGSRFKKLADSPWAVLLVFVYTELAELIFQLLAFSSPEVSHITLPRAHAALIGVCGLGTPLLHPLSQCDDLRRATSGRLLLFLFNATMAIAFVVVALPGLFAYFLEEVPDGTLVVFEPLSGSDLLLKCISASLPQISLAFKLHSTWSEQLATADGSGQPPLSSRLQGAQRHLYRACQAAYLAASWGLGAFALAALFGHDCATFRTCAAPACEPGPVLPFGLTRAELPFVARAAGDAGIDHMMASMAMFATTETDGDGDGEDEWTWLRDVGLQLDSVRMEVVSGEVQLGLGIRYRPEGGSASRVLINGGIGPAGQPGQSNNINPTDCHAPGCYRPAATASAEQVAAAQRSGACEMLFRVGCQEAFAAHAFRHRLSPTLHVAWSNHASDAAGAEEGQGQLYKLELIEPQPECWMRQQEHPTLWWDDLLLWGPAAAVSSTQSGERRQGIVVRNSNCSRGRATAARPGYSCLEVDAAVLRSPGYGRSPLMGSWAFEDATAPEMPSVWATAEFELVFALPDSYRQASGQPDQGGGQDGGGGGGGYGYGSGGGNSGDGGGGDGYGGGGGDGGHSNGGCSACCVGGGELCPSLHDASGCTGALDDTGNPCIWRP